MILLILNRPKYTTYIPGKLSHVIELSPTRDADRESHSPVKTLVDAKPLSLPPPKSPLNNTWKKLQTYTSTPNLLTAAAKHRPSNILSLLSTVSLPRPSGVTQNISYVCLTNITNFTINLLKHFVLE